MQVTPDDLAGEYVVLMFVDPSNPDVALDRLARLQDVASQAGDSLLGVGASGSLASANWGADADAHCVASTSIHNALADAQAGSRMLRRAEIEHGCTVTVPVLRASSRRMCSPLCMTRLQARG